MPRPPARLAPRLLKVSRIDGWVGVFSLAKKSLEGKGGGLSVMLVLLVI